MCDTECCSRLKWGHGMPHTFRVDLHMAVSVALPVPRLAPLTYVVGSDHGTVRVGCRVMVPLGKRVVTGTVIAVDVEPMPGARAIIEVLDDEPTFSPQVLALAKWMAEYYLCTIGEVLHAALPTGLTPEGVMRVSLLQQPSAEAMAAMQRRAPKRAALLEVLLSHQSDVTVAWLEAQLETSGVADQLDALQRAGIIRVTTELEREAGPKTRSAVTIAKELATDDAALRAALDELDRRAPKQSAVLGQLYIAAARGEAPILRAHLQEELHVSPSVIDSLVSKGYATIVDVEVSRLGTHHGPSLASRDELQLPLTDEQRAAIEAVTLDDHHITLLEGVTGSGKTLVYLHLLRRALDAGKTALMLVPEISLTPQLSDRFRQTFGNDVVLLHSRMSVGERVDTWRAVRSGAARIVIGPRSALFAPLSNVGIIIVDEEHEPSYKQEDPAPRYHGRDTAIMRGMFERCPVVLGSATPSLETVWNVRRNRYRHVRLRSRADHAVLPTMHVVDLREERKLQRTVGLFTIPLLDAISDRIALKQGAMLFLNRRGFASQLQCADCADVPMCQHCDVALTWHKHSNVLRCHYCGYLEPARTICTTCGGTTLTDVGTGTQRVEEDLQQWLTDKGITAVVERMDADTTTRRGSHRTLLDRFAKGDIDVLVGTQMIAKGLDIGRVTLVGILNADMSLHQSDFRAAERTIQLITQVAGRAGRTGGSPGDVFIQTSSPTHPAIAAACSGNVNAWIDDELRQRGEAHYPPFERFIVIEISSLDEQRTEHHARILERLIPAVDAAFTRLPVT
ncbi:MAG: primosomal protein N', partial [Candidatus Kapabacteria bacterium]|nr:primosomal protein N' [Candidatus Kapabacteria bacterium]